MTDHVDKPGVITQYLSRPLSEPQLDAIIQLPKGVAPIDILPQVSFTAIERPAMGINQADASEPSVEGGEGSVVFSFVGIVA